MSEDHPESLTPPEAPDWIKHVQWLHYYKDQLVKPPVLVAFVLIALAAYFHGKGKSSDEIAVSRERISFLTDQVSAYKDRLQGATPDQAAKRLNELQANLDAANAKLQMFMPDKPRHLTEIQKRFIRDHSDDLKTFVKSLTVFSWSIGDSPEYAVDFVREFRTNGIAALGPTPVPCNDHQHGVIVGLRDVQHPTEYALQFIRFLINMQIDVGTTVWAEPPAGMDFDLFICS